MTPVETAAAYIRTWAEQVNRHLENMFDGNTEPRVLYESMRYSLLAGGKRLRPVLCLATAQAFGVAEETVLPVAVALEVLHTYSLIHDDLPSMDDDDLRRGRPTNHRVFGEATALLAGDALLTYAFEQVTAPLQVPPARQLEMVRVLAHASGCYGMVAGQMADMMAEGTAGSLADLEFIHAHKTGKLIQAAVEIGALFADLSEHHRIALREYGLTLGHAFQVMDDYLDITGSTEELGKQAGADVVEQKLTYPSVIGIEPTHALALELAERSVRLLRDAGIDAPVLEGLAHLIVTRKN